MSTEDIESRIKHLSLHESSGVPLKKGMSSQYRNNFQPFEGKVNPNLCGDMNLEHFMRIYVIVSYLF